VPGPLAGVVYFIAAFLCGAVPWGYLAGRMLRGVDLRTVGSGGTGATNVLRTLGKGASAAVFVLDFLKGAAPVLIGRALGFDAAWVAAAAVAAVAGHCWSPFIGFKGGKGMATGAGAAIALFPMALAALPVLAGIVWATRYVSLGSLTASLLTSVLAFAFAIAGRLNWPSAIAIIAMTAIIVVRHASNIERLRAGTERRIGQSLAV
jgi:glycerol-3-phosphate acyltransferase PlsY